MTHDKFSGVTFIDIDQSRTQISSEFSVVNTREITLNIRTKRIFYESGW